MERRHNYPCIIIMQVLAIFLHTLPYQDLCFSCKSCTIGTYKIHKILHMQEIWPLPCISLQVICKNCALFATCFLHFWKVQCKKVHLALFFHARYMQHVLARNVYTFARSLCMHAVLKFGVHECTSQLLSSLMLTL